MAAKMGEIKKSPAADARPLCNPQIRERFLSAQEGAALLHKLYRDTHPKAKILCLLALTGARKSEILRAKWEYLDKTRHILKVPLSKSGKSRSIILSAEALAVFESIRPLGASPWIFPGRDPAKPISDIFDYWNKIRRELNLEAVRVHDLRHTFASVLVNSGHSLYEVQKLLGHATPKTTMRYAHLANSALIEAVGKVSQTFLSE